MIRSLVRPLSRPLVRRLVGGLGTSEFDWLQYEPYHLIDLTTAALKTGGDPAGLFDSVATLRNVGTGSDLSQTTASLQGTFLSESMLFGPQVNSNGAIISYTATMAILGDIDIRVKVLFRSVLGSNQYLINRDTLSGARCWGLLLLSTGRLGFSFFTTAGSNVNPGDSTAAVPFTDGDMGWCRVTRDSTTGDVKYWTSTDGLTWDQLGDTRTSTPSGLRSSSTSAYLGYRVDGNPFSGGILAAELYASTDGSNQRIGVDFTDPTIEHGALSFSSQIGSLTVTISQSGDNPAYIIRHPVLRTDGVDDWYHGTFDSAKTGAYVFLVADDLNSSDSYDRFVSMGPTGQNDTHSTSYIPSTVNTGKISTYHSSGQLLHTSTTPKRFLHEIKFLNGEQTSLVNGVDLKTGSLTIAPNLQEIGLNGKFDGGSGSRPPMQYAFMAAFPPTLDSDAVTAIRAELNRRFKLF